MDISLLNIANVKKDIFLFTRNERGVQEIKKVSDFYPFYYEKTNKESKYISYDGIPLKKVFVSEPKEITKSRSVNSYSSDIKFTVNFMTHRINSIQKAPIKYFFIDIENLSKDLPNPEEAKYPISCISVYNSFEKKIYTWYLGDYKDEKFMLETFIEYIKLEKPDILFAWNVDYDYIYLANRVKDFAKKISPIGYARMAGKKDILYPAGISIVDYLKWFKKIHNREASYTLNYIGEKHLGKGKEFNKVNFSILSETIKLRNIGDVQILIDLEEKYQIIPYFDEIRRLSKVQFEDLIYNSRVIEMLLFDEAKIKNIVLPNKRKEELDEEETFKGATRSSEKNGLYENVCEFDLASAYPQMIVNFCLDTQNIAQNSNKTIKYGDEVEWEEYGGITVNGIGFIQNKEALLPSVVKRILKIKDDLKKEVKENPNDKTLATKYDAIKGVVNSAFGVMGCSFFRLYDNSIASSITFLVRDLLMYIKEKIELEGKKVIYWDTDAVFVSSKENIVDKLNQYVQDWAIEKYGKSDLNLSFEYKGCYSSLFLLGRCHYYGYMIGKKEAQVKGIEAKRSSSSKFEAEFQTKLLDDITLHKKSQEDIEKWIREEEKRIKQLPLEVVGFPCKIGNKEYENYPIFLRAYDNTQKIRRDFKVNKGELFFYIFINNGDVLAFTPENKDFIDKSNIDWNQMIERSIFYKTEKIFEARGWFLLKDLNQMLLV